MSQINTRPNISAIDMVCLSSTANAGWSAGMAFAEGCAVAQQAAAPLSTSTGARPKLHSAVHVGEVLTSLRMEAGASPDVERTRGRFIQAIARSGARATDVKRIEMVSAQVRQATTPHELTAAMEVAQREVMFQHGQVMLEQLGVHVQEASREAGFGEIHIRREGMRIYVQALAPNGAGLPSSIHLDPSTVNVQLSTETIGLPDGQCDRVMALFNDALHKRGVRSAIQVKRGGRACLSPRVTGKSSQKNTSNKQKT